MKNEKPAKTPCRYGLDFFKDDYGIHNSICNGIKCGDCDKCVMGLDKAREEINRGLAEITVRANKEIAKLFQRVNSGELLPKGAPIFKLELIHCPSLKEIPLDFGD